MEQVNANSYDLNLIYPVIEEYFSSYCSESVNIVPYKPYTEFSEMIAKGPILTYRLYERKLASLDSDPLTGGTFTNPILLEEDVDQYRFSCKTSRYVFYDNLLEFTIGSTNAGMRDQVRDEFEDFMLVASVNLREAGIKQIYLWEHQPDDSVDIDGTNVYISTVRYFARTRKEIKATEGLLKSIEVSVTVD